MQNKFKGKYYKFVSGNNFSFAIIDSVSNEGPAKQLITKEGSFQIEHVESVTITKEIVLISIHQDNLTMIGQITMSDFHPLRRKAMGPFSFFPMECKHEIYSIYHRLSGEVFYNGAFYSFDNGYGYIEGDSGVNFPKKYIWYNSVGPDYGVTLAVATIPFGPFNFTGILCFISFEGKEYVLCTYNGARIIYTSPEYFEISKGSYRLCVSVREKGGHLLKAPLNGNMTRLIKENVAVETEFTFSRKNKILLNKTDDKSSLEYMF